MFNIIPLLGVVVEVDFSEDCLIYESFGKLPSKLEKPIVSLYKI